MAKIASELRSQMEALPNQQRLPVIIRRKAGTFGPQTRGTRAVDLSQRFELFPGMATTMTAAEVERLSQEEEVEEIWPDLPVQAWLNSSVPKISVPKVWAAGLKGTGIKVAVLDTGIDETHPDFSGRIVATRSFVSESAHDDNGHGTHVAGIVAGSGAKSNGRYVGVAPEASLYIGKVLYANGGGRMSDVMAGIEWAVLEQQVQIINLSLGGGGPCDGTDALSTLCDEAVRQGGVVICVAAGNLGPDIQTISPPGCARYVITVGAINDDGQTAPFSSRGPTGDGRVKPDLVFPGVNIIAPQAAGTQLGPVAEEGYVITQGTSMAAPHAAGVAALLLQAKPDLTAELVKTQMLAGAVSLGGLANEQGVGRGDAYKTYLTVAPRQAEPQPVEPPKPPSEPAKKDPPGCLASLFGKR
jgi:serine protease AprX